MSTVLIADDQAALRRMHGRMLHAQGYEVVGEVANGAAADEAAKRLQPDVVLLDLSMPDYDGLEGIIRIRLHCEKVRIVVLSGFGRARLEPVTLELGAHAYMEKGSHPNDIHACIQEVLSRPWEPYKPPKAARREALMERARELI